MSDKFFLTEKQINCKFCGALIQIPSTSTNTTLKCESCKTLYEYRTKIQIIPKLVFEDETGKCKEYLLNGTTLVGRERGSNYLSLSSEIDQTLKQNIYIRNPFVSRSPHAKIIAKEGIDTVPNGDEKIIIEKKKWLIQDQGSTHGTSVNGAMLKPKELKELKHNDEICLAPDSEMPLAIKFIESIQER